MIATKSSSKPSRNTASKSSRRAKPLMAKVGYTPTRRRYPDGGKVNK